MKINRRRTILAASTLALLLSDCVGPKAPPPRPAPAPAPVRRPAPPPAPVIANWRDADATPGSWSYRTAANGSAAVFGAPGAQPLLWLRCDLSQRVVTLARSGTSNGPVPLSLATTSLTRTATATPEPGTPPALMVRFAGSDAVLDAIAFSRGRFAVEVPGVPRLVLPAYSEAARVVEDCR